MSKKYKVIGVMSGTSLDGLDIAYCEFEKKGKHWKYKIQEATTVNYNKGRQEALTKIMSVSGEDLSFEDANFGKFVGKEVQKFVSKKKLKPQFISSHGHTIFHQPKRGFTTQIGSGAAIYAETKLPVICDFRSVDVALGGQGAPLVPIGDRLLFSQYEFCLNLGGISNISYEIKDKRIAYDISPVNIVLNKLSQQIGLPYDKDGKIASKGQLDKELFDTLNKLDFYKKKFPKSLGKEWVDEVVFPIINNATISIEDKIATFTAHTAYQIAKVVEKNNPKKKSTLLVTGGGALNKFLVSKLQENLAEKVNVLVPDKNTLNFKEALIFAFLGVLRIRNEVNCLKSVTGSSMNNIGGAYYGPILS